MQLKEIMTRNIETLPANATIQQAAEKMASLEVGCLPVVQGQRPVGVLTDRDIVVGVIATGHDPKKMLVRDVMTLEVETLFENKSVGEAARLMEEKQVRWVLICNDQNQIVGVVSLGDLALEQLSEPAQSRS